MTKDYTGKTCPYCLSPIMRKDSVILCKDCRLPHHRDCWRENGGCTTFGCTGSTEKTGGSPEPPEQERLVIDLSDFDEEAEQPAAAFTGKRPKRGAPRREEAPPPHHLGLPSHLSATPPHSSGMPSHRPGMSPHRPGLLSHRSEAPSPQRSNTSPQRPETDKEAVSGVVSFLLCVSVGVIYLFSPGLLSDAFVLFLALVALLIAGTGLLQAERKKTYVALGAVFSFFLIAVAVISLYAPRSASSGGNESGGSDQGRGAFVPSSSEHLAVSAGLHLRRDAQ